MRIPVNAINHQHLIYICDYFTQKAAKRTFCPSAGSHLKSEPLQTVSSHHSGVKLEISDFQAIIKISRQRAIKKDKEVSKTSQESSWKSTENPIYQTVSNIALSRESIALKACILKSH